MKNLILLGILFISTISIQKLQAQPLVTEVNLSADKVWKQFRKMYNIDELSSFVSKVVWNGPKNVGGQRVCTATDGNGFFRENITGFDDASRTYTYQVVEGVPAKNMKRKSIFMIERMLY